MNGSPARNVTVILIERDGCHVPEQATWGCPRVLFHRIDGLELLREHALVFAQQGSKHPVYDAEGEVHFAVEIRVDVRQERIRAKLCCPACRTNGHREGSRDQQGRTKRGQSVVRLCPTTFTEPSIAKRRRIWQNGLVELSIHPEAESASSLAADAIQVCGQGRLLLRRFLENGRPPAAGKEAESNGSREFGGNPLWRAFTQHWAGCPGCSQEPG